MSDGEFIIIIIVVIAVGWQHHAAAAGSSSPTPPHPGSFSPRHTAGWDEERVQPGHDDV